MLKHLVVVSQALAAVLLFTPMLAVAAALGLGAGGSEAGHPVSSRDLAASGDGVALLFASQLVVTLAVTAVAVAVTAPGDWRS